MVCVFRPARRIQPDGEPGDAGRRRRVPVPGRRGQARRTGHPVQEGDAHGAGGAGPTADRAGRDGDRGRERAGGAGVRVRGR